MLKRQGKILNELVRENRFYSFSELSSLLNISQRLVRYAVEELDHNLKCEGFLGLEKKRGKGVKLVVDKEEIDSLLRIFIQEKENQYLQKEDRIVVMLFTIANQQSVVRAIDFQEMFDISKSAVDYDMRSLREECESFNVSVASTHKGGLLFEGGEWEIRLMLNNIINTRVDVLELLKSDSRGYLSKKDYCVGEYLIRNDLLKIYALIKEELRSGEIKANDLYCAQLAIYFAIWKKRIAGNFLLDERDVFINNYVKRHSQQIVEKFLSVFGIDSIRLVEKRYLDLLIDGLNFQKEQKFSEDWIKCQMICVQLIQEMSKIRGIQFSEDPNLFENLMQHVTGVIKRIKENINIYNPLTNLVVEEYLSMFEDIKEVARVFERELNKKINDEEIAYLCMHFCAAEDKLREQKQAKYKVIVLCAHGLATGEVLAKRLKQRYQFDVIAVLSSSEVNAIAKIQADFVLKTSDIEIEGIPSIVINPMPQAIDYMKIQEFIEQHKGFHIHSKMKVIEGSLYEEIVRLAKVNSLKLDEQMFRVDLQKILSKHEIEADKKEVFQPMIKEVLHDEFICLNQSVSNWEDAIKQVGQPLLAAGVINDSYIDAMIDSVHTFGPYIGLENILH